MPKQRWPRRPRHPCSTLATLAIGFAITTIALLGSAAGEHSANVGPDESPYLDAFDHPDATLGLYGEGEPFDAIHTAAEFLHLNPKMRGAVPDPPVLLVEPWIVVSLNGLTCRLFDAQGPFEKVYPVGVGVRARSTGMSITPRGEFSTHPDNSNGWFYIWERWVPEYFGGLPFLRLDTLNEDNHPTYGLHGPIKPPLTRGYVSHGCVRMRPDDIQELFAIAYSSPGTPVRIQREAEYTEFGVLYDSDYPTNVAQHGDLPTIRLYERMDLQIDLDATRTDEEGVRVRATILGADAAKVNHVVFNRDAKWDGNLAPPVHVASESAETTIEATTAMRVYAIALDASRRPVGFADLELAGAS